MGMNPRTLRPGSTFTPRSISGLALWLDAADSSTLFQDTAATIPATATNDPVGAWLDKSGNGRHATQATGASRPTVSATALNGRRQLGLVSQHLRGPSTTWNGSATIYWVGRTGQASNGAIAFHDGTTEQTDAFHAGWLNTQGVGAYGNGWGSGNAPRAESPSAWRNADIIAGVTLSSTEAVARVNGATTNTVAALTGTLSQATAAQFWLGREPSTWVNLNGSLAELLIYQPALSASQRARLERYLAAKWGITLAPQVSNADAQDWINRVYANGGTVSAATASAVNTFCDAIDTAGIRDRFYRLNLFAGNSDASLNAVRTPLFRGPSLGGTQYGGTLDTNVNFVAGDYAETGASGGLLGNGSTKYLETGFSLASLPSAASRHISAYEIVKSANTNDASIGGSHSLSTDGMVLGTRSPATTYTWARGGPNDVVIASASYSGGAHWIGQNNTLRAGQLYKNGALDNSGTNASDFTSTAANTVGVFAWKITGGTPDPAWTLISSVRLGGYSIGVSMTDAQALAYYTAMQAFQTALGRQV